MFHCSTVSCATAQASGLRQHRLVPVRRRAGERAEQAVCAQFSDGHRRPIPDRDPVGGRTLDLHRLEIWRSTDDLARITPGTLEEDLEAASEAIGVESGLLPLDETLQALQPF